MCGLGKALASSLKFLADHQQSVKYKSTAIKTSWPAWIATSSKGRWIGAYLLAKPFRGN